MNENKIPEATTLGELNIHMSHMAESMKKLENKFDLMDSKFVPQIEFIPFKDQVVANAKDIKGLVEWKDGLMGRLIGAGMVVGATFSVVALLINHFWK